MIFFPLIFLILHHMWASEEEFSITWKQVCRICQNVKKMVRKIAPNLNYNWKCGKNRSNFIFKNWWFFPQNPGHISQNIRSNNLSLSSWQVDTSVGQFSLNLKNCRFQFWRPCVRIAVVFFIKNRGLTKTILSIRCFPRKKNFGSQAWQFLAIQEQSDFLVGSHKLLDLEIFNFLMNFFLHYFFDKIIDFEYIFNSL